MSISLNTIVTGMNGGPEAIMQNFNNVKNELDRMNGSVVDVPKEQFTPINGLSIDSNASYCRIYKFNNFAIITIGASVKNVTMKSWTFKEAVTIPKSYLDGFSKFRNFKDTRQITDDGWLYDSNFDVTKGVLTLYTRGNEYNNKSLGLDVAGILYN